MNVFHDWNAYVLKRFLRDLRHLYNMMFCIS